MAGHAATPTLSPLHRHTSKGRNGGEIARAAVVVVAFLLLLMLVGSVVGVRAVASYRASAEAEKSEAHASSRVMFKSADGMTCRIFTFYNGSGFGSEDKTEACYQPPPESKRRPFSWGR